jgi:hypothetical protein
MLIAATIIVVASSWRASIAVVKAFLAVTHQTPQLLIAQGTGGKARVAGNFETTTRNYLRGRPALNQDELLIF